MTPEHVLALYEQKINSHRFEELVPLFSDNAVIWFSDGSHRGLEAIRIAFEETWAKIADETYWLEDRQWLGTGDETAACIYTFHWTGLWDGRPARGKGRGTTVLCKEAGTWKITHEHLSRFPDGR